MSVAATRRSRMEKWYRRLLALYPKDHRREHAEEMVGVLLAADGDTPVRAPNPVAWVVRSGQHAADMADLIDGALRIRGRMALNRIRRTRWLAWTVRDQRWSDALAVVSVIAPLLLLVAALTEFRIPQAVASSITGHPHWGLTATLGLGAALGSAHRRQRRPRRRRAADPRPDRAEPPQASALALLDGARSALE